MSPFSSGLVSLFPSGLVSPFSSGLVSPFPPRLVSPFSSEQNNIKNESVCAWRCSLRGHDQVVFLIPFLCMFLEAVFFVAKTSVCSRRCGHTVQIQPADVDHADTLMDTWYRYNPLM